VYDILVPLLGENLSDCDAHLDTCQIGYQEYQVIGIGEEGADFGHCSSLGFHLEEEIKENWTTEQECQNGCLEKVFHFLHHGWIITDFDGLCKDFRNT
jgi:hypothetical protein